MDNQEVKYKLPNKEELKKKNRRITSIFVLLTTITIDLFGLLAYVVTVKDKQSREKYVVSEEAKAIYTNLLTFIKEACEDNSHPIPNEIIGINYQDNKLLVSTRNETNEIYVTYNHTGDITSAISAFQNSVPSIEGCEIESAYEITSDKELNIGSSILDNQYKGIVSKSITNDYYVSFTGLCSCGSMISMVHQPYSDSGNYTNKLNAPKDNKLVYDLLYVINYQ